MTKPSRKEPVRADLGTKERRARGDVRVTGEAKSQRKAHAESGLERIAAKVGPDGEPRLSAKQLSAGDQYYVSAAAYGVFGRYVGMDLAKEVFGASVDDGGAEWLEDKKREYIAASDLIPTRYKQAMDALILYDASLTEAGHLMGRKGPNSGAIAFPVLEVTLDNLADFYKVTVAGKERDADKKDAA